MREHGWFLSTHASRADKYLASAFNVVLSPAGKGKWSSVAGFLNHFEYSRARGVSLVCCPAASGVSVGGLLPAVCPHCSNMAGLHLGEGSLPELVLGVLSTLAALGFAQSWASPPLSSASC